MVKDMVCFVDEKGRGRFHCPHCGDERQMEITSDILPVESFIEICTCGGKVSGKYLFCTSANKPERLSGYYRMLDGSGQGDLLVKEISTRKAVFTCLHTEMIFPGDKLGLTFFLGNEKRTRLDLMVVVSCVHGMRVTALRWNSRRVPPTGASA